MKDIYETAADEAMIPDDRRLEIIALAKERTRTRLVTDLAEAMHATYILGDAGVLGESFGTHWHATDEMRP